MGHHADFFEPLSWWRKYYNDVMRTIDEVRDENDEI
jgi:hypothetical protein